MTEGVSLVPDLGRYGVWLPSRSVSPGVAQQIEAAVDVGDDEGLTHG